MRRPARFGHCSRAIFQKSQRELPVCVHLVGDQLIEPVPRHLAGRHVVDQAGEIVGKAESRGRAVDNERGVGCPGPFQLPGPSQDQLRQQRAALKRPEGRWQLQCIARRRAGGGLGEDDLILVDIAQGHDARQDRSVGVERVEKCLARHPARALGRQINGRVSQSAGSLSAATGDELARQERVQQGRQKGCRRRDRIEARRAVHGGSPYP